MISRVVYVATLFLAGCQAFEDASPFLLVSSTKNLDFNTESDGNSQSLSTTNLVEDSRQVLDSCPADAYILVDQPGLHSSDFEHSETVAPHLAKVIDSAAAAQEVANVYYSSSSNESRKKLKDFLLDNCKAKELTVDPSTGSFKTYVDTTPRVITMDFDPITTDDKEGRTKQLRNNDDLLYSVISLLPSPNYVLVYTSSPAGANTYRQEETTVQETANFNLTGDSLFENYKFFSPGIFMGTLVAIFLLLILSQAVSWLSDLQVSYKSFEGKRESQSKQQ
ncbi:hypothetical protein TRICI_002882 [Trichomonascus ciferrii]|uniref:Protein BIG1 n=1 Tax=Trichomonascus ciferrii TaxID=44093 RepID=A0A642V5C8_9ASCO|nr:hypothetical protein TRICI_002882 [Trichomonascus ciferrii]